MLEHWLMAQINQKPQVPVQLAEELTWVPVLALIFELSSNTILRNLQSSRIKSRPATLNKSKQKLHGNIFTIDRYLIQ